MNRPVKRTKSVSILFFIFGFNDFNGLWFFAA